MDSIAHVHNVVLIATRRSMSPCLSWLLDRLKLIIWRTTVLQEDKLRQFMFIHICMQHRHRSHHLISLATQQRIMKNCSICTSPWYMSTKHYQPRPSLCSVHPFALVWISIHIQMFMLCFLFNNVIWFSIAFVHCCWAMAVAATSVVNNIVTS